MIRQVFWGALVSIAGSVLVTLALIGLIHPGGDAVWVALIVSVAIPLLIGLPSYWFLHSQHQKISHLQERLHQSLDELKGLNAEVERRAAVDAVTGLLNRESFMTRSRFRRRRSDAGYVLVIEVDQYRETADRFGPDGGDRALLAAVRVMRDAIRETDLLARIDHAEFALLLKDIGPEKAWDMAESIRRGVERTTFSPSVGVQTSLTVSIGIAPAPVGLRMHDIMVHADRSLLAARDRGRNRVGFWPRAQDEDVQTGNLFSYSKAS